MYLLLYPQINVVLSPYQVNIFEREWNHIENHKQSTCKAVEFSPKGPLYKAAPVPKALESLQNMDKRSVRARGSVGLL